MNILPLVFSFLLIFALFSNTLMRNALSFTSEKNAFCQHLQAKQQLRSKWERYKYNLTYKKNNKKEEDLSTAIKKSGNRIAKTGKTKTYESPRLDTRYNIKWNLLPLIQNKQQESCLEFSCAIFLEKLYGHTFFWKEALKKTPDLAKKLVSSFKEKRQEDPIEDLSQLFPQDLVLQKVFYKMLKGSGVYNLKNKEGHPPLEDFFWLDPEGKKSLHLPQTSYYALEAILGDAIAKEILSIEKEKYQKTGKPRSITKEELSSLLDTAKSPLSIKEFSSLAYFSRHSKLPAKKISHQEQNIVVQIPAF